MLQRAASNAYSWWWSSHIRVRQGKWLQQSLEDMEEKVKNILEVIEEDADSFGKRAEMYYKKRPELINFVEESYRAYRALAERYQHVSGELQSANNTIAHIFPDQVNPGMEDSDDENATKASRCDPSKAPKAPENPKFKMPLKEMKRLTTLKSSKSLIKGSASQMSKEEAKEEIDKLQKRILVLQTEKEFMKSSYETGISKYWAIEKQIEDIQERICSLQDESDVDSVIEDNDARALMTASAMKSCEKTLLALEERRKKSDDEAQIESERVKDAEDKLTAFKKKHLHQHNDNQETCDEAKTTDSSVKNLEENVPNLKQERLELQSVCEKVKEYFEINSAMPITVMEFAEMIDELVTKVLSLESAVASLNALIKRLKSECDELHKNLHSLEEDKMSLIDDSKNLNDKVRELEEELHRIQDLKRSVDDQRNKLQTDFTETCRSLDNLSEKLQTHKKKDKNDIKGATLVDASVDLNAEPLKESEEQKGMQTPVEDSMEDKAVKLGGKESEEQKGMQTPVEDSMESKDEAVELEGKESEEQKGMQTPVEDSMESKDEAVELEGKVRGIQDLNLCNKSEEENNSQPEIKSISENVQDPQQDVAKYSLHADDSVQNAEPPKQNVLTVSPDCEHLFSNGMEGREKILSEEYTSILQNYRETKNRLSEMEKKNQDSLFEVLEQIRELRSANSKKDMEIRLLKQKLSNLQTDPEDDLNGDLADSGDSHQTRRGTDQWKYLFTEFQKRSSSKTMSTSMGELLKERSFDLETKSSELSSHEEEKINLSDEPHAISHEEVKIRRDIDGVLEENLEFWMRFSAAFHQIQKFQKKVQNLQKEFLKHKDKKQEVGTSDANPAEKSAEALTIEKDLREFQTELSVWVEQNNLMKEELQRRFSSLCKIEEGISEVSKTHSEAEEKLTAQQAAKFQGEVLNMKQENDKIADELQSGMYLVRGVQLEVLKMRSKLQDKTDTPTSKNDHPYHNQVRRSSSSASATPTRNKVPLRSFLFGTKPKKPSLFACMSPSPQRQYSDVKYSGKGTRM